MENNTLHELVGRTIKSIEWIPVSCEKGSPEYPVSCPYDDGDRMKITTTDGYSITFTGGYHEDYTGNSKGEYPTYLSVNVQAPEGFNGPGMYEALIKSKQSTGDLQELYGFTFRGEYKDIPFRLFRFNAGSLEQAKSFFNLDEVEYVKWVNK